MCVLRLSEDICTRRAAEERKRKTRASNILDIILIRWRPIFLTFLYHSSFARFLSVRTSIYFLNIICNQNVGTCFALAQNLFFGNITYIIYINAKFVIHISYTIFRFYKIRATLRLFFKFLFAKTGISRL